MKSDIIMHRDGTITMYYPPFGKVKVSACHAITMECYRKHLTEYDKERIHSAMWRWCSYMDSELIALGYNIT